MKWTIIGSSIPVAIFLILTGCSSVRHFVEQPDYTVVRKDGKIQVRKYPPVIVAEVDATGARWDAANQAFGKLADYIFGENVSGQKIAMTSPVTEQAAGDPLPASEKIAMTSPVTQQPADQGQGTWTVQFTMPAKYTMETLPKPKNEAVRLREVSAKSFAVIRFSGRARDSQVAAKLDRLKAYMEENKLVPLGVPTYAYYDPPWTLPFLRRNEILIEIDSSAEPTATP